MRATARLARFRTRTRFAGALALAGCTSTTASSGTVAVPECSIPQSQILSGGPAKDGIPALTNPPLVTPANAGASYLRDSDRIIGITVGSRTIAIPLNIEWWHEVVNLDLSEPFVATGSVHLAVTHCPLTGSSLVFDRGPVQDVAFGVSGLLYQDNLIMYDRTDASSLWPQLLRGARCGPRSNTQLAMYPAIEMTWSGWRSLHPDTRVVSSQTGVSRDYRTYPYGAYADEDNARLLFPLASAVDGRRPPKERVLGVVIGDAPGIAFPFGTLRALGAVGAVSRAIGGKPVVVLWDGAREAAAAFQPVAAGQSLTIRAVGDTLRDIETGSTWRVDGLATAGPLAGTQLQPISDQFTAYWFAWAAFYPTAQLWTGP